MVGLLYYVAACALPVAGAIIAFLRRDADGFRVGIMFALLAAGFGFAGYLIRKLDARARYAGSIMSVLGMFALPIGTVLGGYALYLLHCKQGRAILSPEYREVVGKTPEFQCRPAHAALALGIGLVVFAVYNVMRLFLIRSGG